MESVEMESSATEEFAGSSPQIARRKRTRRRRTGASSSRSGGDDGDMKGCIPSEEDRNYESTVTTEEEEEEAMANCLILLARSGGGGLGVVHGEDSGKTEKKRKKKINSSAEISAVGGNVYECKTCDKTFMSFQALGGHRASHHKKTKLEQVKLTSSSIDDQVQMLTIFTPKLVNIKTSSASSSSSVALHYTKVHECAICGSAFSSGQALGGHMRRHRTALISANQMAAAAAVAVAVESPHEETAVEVEIAVKSNNYLSSLDLNLPAPDEEDLVVEDHHKKFHQQFFMGHDNNNNSASEAALVFSAPPLVGCYF